MNFTIAYKSELHTYIDELKTQKCPCNDDIHVCVCEGMVVIIQ